MCVTHCAWALEKLYSFYDLMVDTLNYVNLL